MLTVLILVISFVIAIFRQSSVNVNSFQDSTRARRVLLVTAHPDDECLFFGPTLLSFLHVRPIPEVFSLCLSIGDADGLGEIRKEELGRSLDILGVDKSRRWLIDSPYVTAVLPGITFCHSFLLNQRPEGQHHRPMESADHRRSSQAVCRTTPYHNRMPTTPFSSILFVHLVRRSLPLIVEGYLDTQITYLSQWESHISLHLSLQNRNLSHGSTH
jgi:hypothetical protein